jgi:hypothetical protein
VFTASPNIDHGRFTKPFELDNGALTVMPLSASYRPVRNIERVAEQAWSTDRAGTRAGLVGLGVVTISKTYKGVAPVKNLVAWVALTDSVGITRYCQAQTRPFPRAPKLPSAGQSAVVIGDAPGSAAVVFASRDFFCWRLAPATAFDAVEQISVPWVSRDGTVSVKIPPCSFNGGPGLQSTRTFTRFDYEVQQYEAPASAISLATEPGCAPARTISLRRSTSRGVNHKTYHQISAGPFLQVVPCLLPDTGRSPVRDLTNTSGFIPTKLTTCAWHPSAK